jgi:hypothetical protein
MEPSFQPTFCQMQLNSLAPLGAADREAFKATWVQTLSHQNEITPPFNKPFHPWTLVYLTQNFKLLPPTLMPVSPNRHCLRHLPEVVWNLQPRLRLR